MRFAPNLPILWPDLPVAARPGAAAALGFDAAETWWPFAGPEPTSRDVDELVRSFDVAGVRLVLLNLWLGDQANGHHGLLSVAAEEERFRANLYAAVRIVRRLGGTIVNSHYGNVTPHADRAALDRIVVARLAFAADLIGEAGATLVLEALNPVDFPRYGVHHAREALGLIGRARELTSAPIGLLYDVYHAVRAGDDPLEDLAAFGGEVVHVQVADVPGRGRPGSGDVPFGRVFAALESAGYDGFVGLEHLPSVDPGDTFSWLRPSERLSGRRRS